MVCSDLLPDDSDLKASLCCKNLTQDKDISLDLTKLDHQNFLAEVSLQLLNCKCLSEELGLQQYNCTVTVEQDFESVYQTLRCWVEQRIPEATLFVLLRSLKNLGTTLDLCTYHNRQVVTDDQVPSEALYVQADFLRTISQKIASQWKFVGRFLGLAEHIIQNVSSQEKDDIKQAYHMLLTWKQQNKNATCYAVAKAVRIINQHAAKPFSLNDALCYTSKYVRDITHESTQGELMLENDSSF